MRPIAHLHDKPVPDRVEVDVIDMPGKIGLIADLCSHKRRCQMPFSRRLRFAVRALCSGIEIAGKAAFDRPPAGRVIGAAIGEAPGRVEIIGKHTDRQCAKRPAHGNTATCGMQTFDVIGQRSRPAIRERNGDEEPGPRSVASPIVRHAKSVAGVATGHNKKRRLVAAFRYS